MNEKYISNAVRELSRKFPLEKERIKTGVKQVAKLWDKKDGPPKDFENFCSGHFFAGEELQALFERFQSKFEQIQGHLSALQLALRLEIDEETGKPHPVDRIFAGYSPADHFTDDMFRTKLAFTALLNFPVKTLHDCLLQGPGWSRSLWAQIRLAQQFAFRIPANVQQKVTKVYAEASSYVNNYNIFMDRVTDETGKPVFREGLRLISHWGLRDELKSLYTAPDKNLQKQKTIHAIMERIIAQDIPQKAINNPDVFWNPLENSVDGKKSTQAGAEPDTRYRHFLNGFLAHKLEDKYCPEAPTHIERRFKLDREIPEAEVENMFLEVLTARAGRDIAGIIAGRLGRSLLPFDIWYDGFKPRGPMPEEELNKIVAQKYPDLEAFQKDIPVILEKLGFDGKTAQFLAARIEADPARGAGHAWGPGMRTEKAHLRTRVAPGGMDYQGFNVAMHELGHCAEQIFSMYRIDHTLLEGVPNTAFTEGFAFVFQSRDLDMLGLKAPDENIESLNALDVFWATREIAGVALVDMNIWRWLYKHPKATARRLKEAVIKIAGDIWNKYYAPVFGVKDSPLLAVYSHMICHGMYLPDYPLGHIIAFQIEDYFKSHPLGSEMERMCRLGRITPAEWMRQAIGSSISPQPLIKAAEKAAETIKVKS